MPRTSGSLTVYWSSYSRVGSKPFFKHTRVGSGVPGNGVVSQEANAQSALAIFVTPDLTPSAVSESAEINVAFDVSSVAAGYAGVPRDIRIRAVLPFWSSMRAMNGPTMLLPSRFVARGT